jgi:Mg/Co/Ni transporter MgtE
MEIQVIDKNIFEVKGIIKTMKDVEKIKEAIEKYSNKDSSIILKIIDSFTIPSTVISYLIKLHELEKKDIIIEIKDKNLYELLQDLELDKSFTLKKI